METTKENIQTKETEIKTNVQIDSQTNMHVGLN